MIVRQFISWIRTAPAGERAEATRALARAWLISDLSEDDRIAAEGALLMLLDDPSPLVRQAMAEVFSRSSDAPAAIVQALSLDQPSIALPVLEYSPLLIDADLVDIVATGNCDMQCAIARRRVVPASVCAAIAEVGSAAAALELIENAYAELAPFSWDRIVERHGHLAAIRESMLVLEDLPAATRAALVAKLSETLAQFVVARNWLSADRAGRITAEACERSAINIAAGSRALMSVPAGSTTESGRKQPWLAMRSAATRYFNARRAALLPAAVREAPNQPASRHLPAGRHLPAQYPACRDGAA